MHTSPSARTAIAMACTAFVTAAGAQQQTAPRDGGVVFDVNRIVITAPAIGSLSSRSLLTSVDSIGSDTVQGTAVGANWELIARVPGVQLTNFNQGTTSGKPSFRGFNGEGEVNAVKLLIDGVPSNSNDGNMPYLDLVVPLGLQGVTAVRGTNDARYGLHNIAGSLELLTRRGGNATDARLGVGPWGKVDASVAVDRESGGFTQNVALGVRHADGWRDHAKSDRTSLSGQWSWQPQGLDVRYGLALRAHRTEAEEPGYLEAKDAYTTPRQSYAISATDGGKRDLGQAVLSAEGGQRSALAWRALVYLNRFKDERFVRFSATASQQERDTDETHTGARVIVSWRPQVPALPGFALEGGVDTERQRNTSLRFNTTERVRVTQTRDQHWTFNVDGAFVQAILQPLPSLKLVPGFRVDRVSGQFDNRLANVSYGANDYGLIQQPKISAVWTASDALSVYANWGRSFQVGVGAASYKIPPRTSDLKASINDGAELGLKFKAGSDVDGRIAVWQQTATNEVYRDLNNPSGDSINIGATRRRGVDLQVRARPAATVEAFATLGLQEAIITTPNPAAPTTLGKEVDHTPRQLVNAGVDWQAMPALKFSAWVQGQGSYYLERTNTLTGKFGSYTTLNLGASWALSPTLQLDAQLLNAANGRREYVWWDGAKTLHSAGEPRSLNLALRASF
jgi:iron complex outermembrane recepter protein